MGPGRGRDGRADLRWPSFCDIAATLGLLREPAAL